MRKPSLIQLLLWISDSVLLLWTICCVSYFPAFTLLSHLELANFLAWAKINLFFSFFSPFLLLFLSFSASSSKSSLFFIRNNHQIHPFISTCYLSCLKKTFNSFLSINMASLIKDAVDFLQSEHLIQVLVVSAQIVSFFAGSQGNVSWEAILSEL